MIRALVLRRIKSVLAAVLLTLVVCAPSFGQDSKVDFSVGQQPLGKALYSFAKQAGISIARPPMPYRDGKSTELEGRYTVDDALQQLLAGTEFGYRRISTRAIRILRRPPAPSVQALPEITDEIELPIVPEILVSATRRGNFVQKLPYAITAISATHANDLATASVKDVAHHAAGLYATSEGLGRNKVIIRGLSDGPFSGRVQSLVSTYLDYTRLTYNAPDPGLLLYDIDRIEILRGPQGTLYGSGALGGLYRVVSREPSLEENEVSVGSAVAFTRSGDPSAELSATTNLAMPTANLGVRLLAYYRNDGGYIDDSRLNLENVNRTSATGGRFSAKLKPSDKWHFLLSSSYQKVEADDSNYYSSELSRLERDNFIREPREDEFFRLGGTLVAEFGWGEIVSATAWINRKVDQQIDASTAVPILAGIEPRPSPFIIDRDIKAITNETHVTSALGNRTEWLLGAFFSHRQETVRSSLTVPGAGDVLFLGGEDQIYRERLEDELDEFALFGELTYYLNRNIFITAGGRWFHYDDTAFSDLKDIGSLVPFRADGKQKKSGFTPKIMLAGHFGEAGLVYAQVAQGYRVGGINLAGLTPVGDIDLVGFPELPDVSIENPVLANFDSDEMTNYEVGIKNAFMGGKLILNAAGFYAKWNKIQSYQYGFDGLPEIANVGDARIVGFEIEAGYWPSQQTELLANISWNTSKLTATNNSFGAQLGDSLPGAPKFSANVSARRDFDLFDLPASFGVEYSYVGGARLLFDPSTSPKMDAYHLTNVHLSLSAENWQFTLFVNNVFDSDANVFAFGNPFALNVLQFEADGRPGGGPISAPAIASNSSGQHTPLRPRSAGLRARWKF